ncbi:oxidoreductase [Phlyctema vagabunda]|uniref:Oxidoreductase n=1 Tax=Phlyctema vagabunda TaxID=108571 RepID=A0ABR4PU99_9HELO
MSEQSGARGRIVSNPITVRWDSTNDVVGTRKIQFPLAAQPPPKKLFGSEHLHQHIKPLHRSNPSRMLGDNGEKAFLHGFGGGGRLRRDQFSVDFDPHAVGILDAISQILLPCATDLKGAPKLPFLENRPEHRGLVAELQQMDILTGSPEEMMHSAHRSGTLIGTLVVCLPYAHEGGELAVKYNDDTTTFDFSQNDPTSISWAAFYSNCSYTVGPVRRGHRITLSYNLCLSERIGNFYLQNKVIDLSSHPLYRQVKDWRASPDFFRHGGILGYYCQHRYAHNDEAANVGLAYALRGVDAVFSSIFRSLGYQIDILPMLCGDPQVDDLPKDTFGVCGSPVLPGFDLGGLCVPTERFYSEDRIRSQRESGRIRKGKSKGKGATTGMGAASDHVVMVSKFQGLQIVDKRPTAGTHPASLRYAKFNYPHFMMNSPRLDGWDTAMVKVTSKSAAAFKSYPVLFVTIPTFVERLSGLSRLGI